MLKLVKRLRAKLDIIELTDYIAQDNPEAAEEFLLAIEAAFHLLLHTPSAGARRDYLESTLENLRMWPVKGYEKHLIFYRTTTESLEIVRVLHASRDIESIFREADE